MGDSEDNTLSAWGWGEKKGSHTLPISKSIGGTTSYILDTCMQNHNAHKVAMKS